MLTVVKRYKNPKARKLGIYNDGKLVCYAERCWGWFCFTTRLDEEMHNACRALIMENFYWLLGSDCDYDEWEQSIEDWDAGKHIYNVPIDELPPSMFFEGEKEIALNSFYNV